MKRIAMVTLLMSLVCIGSLFARPQTPQVGFQGTPASISGFITLAGTGRPIPNAQVLVSRIAAPAGLPYPERQRGDVALGTSDEQGRFQITNLDAGSYRVIAASNGFTNSREGALLTVNAGQQVQDVNLRLNPTATLTGKIVDATTGEPLPDITVQSLRSTFDAAGKRTLVPVASVRTNDMGEYRLYWVNPGRYYVSAIAALSPIELQSASASQSGMFQGPRAITQLTAILDEPNPVADSGFLPTYYPGTVDLSRAISVEVDSGQEARLDFPLLRGEKFHIHGSVIDAATGHPPLIVSISVSPRGAMTVISSGDETAGSTLNQDLRYDSATGEFEVRNVAPGSYWLQVYAQPSVIFPLDGSGPGDELSSQTEMPPRLSPPTFARIPLDISRSSIDNIKVSLATSVSIGGRIRIEGELHPDQNVLGNILVTLQSSGGGAPVFLSAEGKESSPRERTLELTRIAPGEYHLISNAGPTMYLKDAQLNGAEALDEFSITGRTEISLDVTFSTNAGMIEGTLIGSDLKPAVGIEVVLIPERQRNRLDLYKTAVSDMEGHFSLSGIAPGDYRLFAWEDLERFSYFDSEVLGRYESQGKPVHIQESAKETIVIRSIPAAQ